MIVCTAIAANPSERDAVWAGLWALDAVPLSAGAASLAGLSPTVFIPAGIDPSASGAEALAVRLAAAGVECRLITCDGLPHSLTVLRGSPAADRVPGCREPTVPQGAGQVTRAAVCPSGPWPRRTWRRACSACLPPPLVSGCWRRL